MVVTDFRLLVPAASVVRLARAVVPPTAALNCAMPLLLTVRAWAPSTVFMNRTLDVPSTVVSPARVTAPMAEKTAPVV